MTEPPSDDDLDVPEWVLAFGRLLGANEIRVRWKVIRFKRRVRWLRRELVPPSRGFEHQICPACGAVQHGRAATCGACGDRLGSRLTRSLRALGLSVPSSVSASSLLGFAMIAIYGRMVLARPGQGIWSWDTATLLAFGANWGPAVHDGQWYRLATSVFLHIGLLHLGFNLLALSQVGPSIEDVFGRGRMVLLFMVTGVAASAASALGQVACSAGASGAIMGLIGVAAGWGHRLGTTHGRNVRDQMLKWGAYTMVYGVALRADHWAHGGGFVAGALLGFAFRPQTLERTKASRGAIAMGVVGTAAAITTVFVALAPPSRSLELARAMEESWETNAQATHAGDDVSDYWAAWGETCALHARGERAEAMKRAGFDRLEEHTAVDRDRLLDAHCDEYRAVIALCEQLRGSGGAADPPSEEQRRIADRGDRFCKQVLSVAH